MGEKSKNAVDNYKGGCYNELVYDSLQQFRPKGDC